MSLSALKPAFAIPKLMQLQGFILEGAGAPFWDAQGTEQAVEDIAVLLKVIHPVLIDLTLAGYEVERLIFSVQDAAPSKLLDIDLATLHYEILAYNNLQDDHSYWYMRTGTEWATDAHGTSDDVPTLPSDTSAAVAMIIRARDYWQTDEVAYALNLQPMLIADDALLANLSATQQSLVVYTTESLPTSSEQPVSTMGEILKRLSFLLVFSIGTFTDRWLAVDCEPVGLLHNLNPDKLIDCLRHGPVDIGPKPNRWGCPYKLSPAEECIIEVCRQVWQYLQAQADFSKAYGPITSHATFQLLAATWEYLKGHGQLSLSIVSPQGRQHAFMNAIREKVRQDSGYRLPDDFLGKLVNLPWIELLMLLHNMRVIDMLSGVSVTDTTIIIAPVPDLTGFYESDDGSITVQLNQAEDYLWGFLQERKPSSVPNFTGTFHKLNYFALEGDSLFYYKGIYATPLDPFSFTQEQPSYTNEGQLVLHWTLSRSLAGKNSLTLIRYSEAPALPDETLHGLPQEDIDGNPIEGVTAFELTQRAPLGPADEADLDVVVNVIAEYLQAYHGSVVEPGGVDKLNWLIKLQETIRLFAIIKTADGLTNDQFPEPWLENDQFPLVRYRLRAKLQVAPLGLSATDTRSLYLGLLEMITRRGEDHLEAIDKYILYLTGIASEEALALDYAEAFGDGRYTYEFRAWSLSAQVGVHPPFLGFLGASVTGTPTIIKVRRISEQSNEMWSAHYYGTVGAPGVGAGAPLDVSVIASISSWTKLYAKVQWEPSDFAGLVSFASVTASAAPGIAFQLGFVSITTFFELEKGTESGYGRLVAISRLKSLGLGDLWNATQFGVGLDLSITASLGCAYFIRIPFTTSIDDQTLFEPMYQVSSYTSQLPAATSGVHFNVSREELTLEGKTVLKQFTAKFRAYLVSPLTVLEIHGHASPSGSAAFNLDLSAKRAQTVYDYLYALVGDAFLVPTQQTIVMGHGEWDARYLGQVPDGVEVAEWRRVDIVINGALVCSVFGEKG